MRHIHVLNSGPNRSLKEAVFFPFDPFNVPLLAGLSVNLVRPVKRGPVVRKGEEGAADQHNLRYYGSVIKLNGRYHMWYLGGGDADDKWIGDIPNWRPLGICYATSEDGIHWEKPSLGLVEYNGSRDNNLVGLNCARVAACVVIYDPEDPDPHRRFKMVFESTKYEGHMAVAFSSDGLRWRESAKNPVLPYALEMMGLIRIGNCYFCNGQASGMPCRMLCTVTSYDFEDWTIASNVGHRRDNIPGRLPVASGNVGPQVHLGASLWDRGNTILGFYGIWNGVNRDRRSVVMDLGLVVTRDALYYYEPIPDGAIVPAEEESDGATPALMQGQGCENIGDETFFWYSAWREGEVRLARWARDRLGYVCIRDESGIEAPHLWTSPFQSDDGTVSVFLNVDGISAHNRISVEVTNERFQPLSGFEAVNCQPVVNGLRSRVTWKEREVVSVGENPVRLRITFEGLGDRDIKLYCAYVKSESHDQQPSAQVRFHIPRT